MNQDLKGEVRQFWQKEPCGTHFVPQIEDRRRFFSDLESHRYSLEPFIKPFARFERGKGRRILEVGTGAGTDFVNWVRNGADAVGIDLTSSGIGLTRERLALEGHTAKVAVGDAENLPFTDNALDLVYSCGVVHHTPNTQRAIDEIRRVLRPGGSASILIYHVPSWTGWVLWLRFCLARMRPCRTPRWAIFHHCESPGTKAYSVRAALKLFKEFSHAQARCQLTAGDLLLARPQKPYKKWYYPIAWALYPRWLIRFSGNLFGYYILIDATK